MILEVLRILRAEVDLRELTRAAEQSREAVTSDDYLATAAALQETQMQLRRRTATVIDNVESQQAQEGRNFSQDLQRLYAAESAMGDATTILSQPETGAAAIAAETAAIEALLQTRRGNGSGAAGSGVTPGGSRSGGETNLAPAALTGIGDGIPAESRVVHQTSGGVEDPFPDEYRATLDAYFSALEEAE